MSQSSIILADTDEIYLAPLETKFLEELGDDALLQVITDPAYFAEFFSKPQTGDILVVSEDLYTDALQKHNMGHIFVLSETPEDVSDRNSSDYVSVYKYTSIKEIYDHIMAVSHDSLAPKTGQLQKTVVILVTSASGGVGKTTLAMGIGACLAQKYKKVLYVDAQMLNTFQFYLEDRGTLPYLPFGQLMGDPSGIFDRLRAFIRTEAFDYLPPFGAALDTLGGDFSIYEAFIRGAKASGIYDVIIIDTDTVLSAGKAALMTFADKVLLLTGQTASGVFAMNAYVKNINCSDREKFYFVCSNFDSSRENALVASREPLGFMVNEYVGHVKDIDMLDLRDFVHITDIARLAWLLV